MSPRLLLAVYMTVTLLPLGLAGQAGLTPRGMLDEIATGAGLLAFAIILVEFALSGRFRSVSRQVGMDVTMRLHQLLARSAILLVLLHPFLYQSPRRPELPWDPSRSLTVSYDLASLSSGIAALVLLAVLVVLGIWRDRLPYRYETWRLLHGLFAFLVAALVLHHALSAGRYSSQPALVVFWIGLFLTATFSLCYVYVLKPMIQRRRPWRVASVRPVALKTWELALEPDGHDGLDYEAGQFGWLNIGQSPFRLAENPFSFSSAPQSGRQLQFVIKELGDFTCTIGSIAPGTTAYIDGPHGNLVVAGRQERRIALIAGGVGIAPLLSILRALHEQGDQRPVTLVYGNRVQDQIAYADEIGNICARGRLTYVPILSEPPSDWRGRTGRVDAALVRDLFAASEAASYLYILCGPPQMMTEVEETLIALGVRGRQILLERFSYD